MYFEENRIKTLIHTLGNKIGGTEIQGIEVLKPQFYSISKFYFGAAVYQKAADGKFGILVKQNSTR